MYYFITVPAVVDQIFRYWWLWGNIMRRLGLWVRVTFTRVDLFGAKGSGQPINSSMCNYRGSIIAHNKQHALLADAHHMHSDMPLDMVFTHSLRSPPRALHKFKRAQTSGPGMCEHCRSQGQHEGRTRAPLARLFPSAAEKWQNLAQGPVLDVRGRMLFRCAQAMFACVSRDVWNLAKYIAPYCVYV